MEGRALEGSGIKARWKREIEMERKGEEGRKRSRAGGRKKGKRKYDVRR